MKMKKNSAQSPAVISVLMMLLYAFSNGVQYIGYNHIPLFISSQAFADESTIGYATAIGAVATIAAQLFWGRISDAAKSKNRVLAAALLGMSLSALLFWNDMPSAAFLYASMPVFYFFFLAPQSMSDTICIENISKTGRSFGFIRSAAPMFSTCLALCMVIFPNVSVKTMIIVYTICPLLAVAPALLLPKTRGYQTKSSVKDTVLAMRQLLSNRKLLLLLIFGFLGFTFGNIPTTYFSVYYSTARGLNAGTSMLGLFFAVSIASEVFILMGSGRLLKKVNPYAMLTVLLGVNGIRMLLIYLIQNPYLMLVTAFFQAAWFGLIFSSVIPLINSIVTPENRATGQSLWVLTAFGLSQISGNLLAGVLADFISLRSIFLVGAIGFVVLLITLGPVLLRQGRTEQEKEE